MVVNSDGTVSFALPRAEVGQGITTAVAMTIADEMDLALDKVKVTLADARPELVLNQLTGGSNSMHSIWTPLRVAAAIARGQLLTGGGGQLLARARDPVGQRRRDRAPDGRTTTYGALAARAAVSKTRMVTTSLKPPSHTG